VIGGARFEILPFARGEEEAAQLPEPAHLTLTTSPKHGLDHTVDTAVRLRALGHTITVHFACRMVRSPGHLDELLGKMADAGIDDAFCVAGDATPPEGPYASALELLPVIAGHPQRPRTIGITGYPEGHPLIDDATLDAALAEKTPYADYVTTQLCFDPKAILGWLDRTELPVVVGLPGIVDRKKLMEISMRVGVGPSLRYLRKQGGIRNLLRLSGASADRLLDALEPHDDRIAGFHYFTFNRLLETWHWERAKHPAGTTIDPEPRKEVV
jgi:methylenetetrahydrofolate reductase (NADPH)